jgi:hypothetical protein
MEERAEPAPAGSSETHELWTLLQVDQQRITALDTVSVAIRGWVLTLDSALVAFAFTRASPSVIAVATAATLLFMPLEFRYRRTQLLHAQRSGELSKNSLRNIGSGPSARHAHGRILSACQGIPRWAFYGALLVLLFSALLAI